MHGFWMGLGPPEAARTSGTASRVRGRVDETPSRAVTTVRAQTNSDSMMSRTGLAVRCDGGDLVNHQSTGFSDAGYLGGLDEQSEEQYVGRVSSECAHAYRRRSDLASFHWSSASASMKT